MSEDDKSAQQALRRQFARQQAKELTEHTKQLHAKDMELEAMRQQVSKVSDIHGSIWWEGWCRNI